MPSQRGDVPGFVEDLPGEAAEQQLARGLERLGSRVTLPSFSIPLMRYFGMTLPISIAKHLFYLSMVIFQSDLLNILVVYFVR